VEEELRPCESGSSNEHSLDEFPSFHGISFNGSHGTPFVIKALTIIK
jgi:hypothetical protein